MDFEPALVSADPFVQLVNPELLFEMHERSASLSDLPRRIYRKLDDMPVRMPTQEQLRVDAAIEAGRTPPACR